MEQDQELWEELIEIGRKIENERDDIQHSMSEEQRYRILGTIDYIVSMGVPDPMRLNAQWEYDTGSKIGRITPKYRLFDEIGMAMGGRLGEDDDTVRWAHLLAKTYVACVKEFGANTRKEVYNCIPKKIYEIKKKEK